VADVNRVGTSNLSFTYATSWYGATGITIDFPLEVKPVCDESPIVFNTFFNPVSIERETTYDLTVPATDVYHEYETLWASRGYPDACTVGLSIGGPVAEYSVINGYVISVSPTSTTIVGIDELYIYARFTDT